MKVPVVVVVCVPRMRFQAVKTLEQGNAVQMMAAGPPESLCRQRLQITLWCCGQNPWYWAFKEKAVQNC